MSVLGCTYILFLSLKITCSTYLLKVRKGTFKSYVQLNFSACLRTCSHFLVTLFCDFWSLIDYRGKDLLFHFFRKKYCSFVFFRRENYNKSLFMATIFILWYLRFQNDPWACPLPKSTIFWIAFIQKFYDSKLNDIKLRYAIFSHAKKLKVPLWATLLP